MKYDKAVYNLTAEQISEWVLREREKTKDTPSAVFLKDFDVDELVENKCTCYRIRPKQGFNGTYIIYLYGSYTCRGISREQWDFIMKTSLETGCGLFVPMYPLAPESCCRDVFAMLKKAYGNFCMGHDVEKVILMGDNSGAGLALSLTLLSWKEGLRKPDKLILISPFMDTEFFDKDMEKRVELAAVRLRQYWCSNSVKEFINNYWVKDYAVKTEYTSPFYEDFTDLCDEVVVFSGTDDIFNCYASEFYKKAKQQGVNVKFFEFEGEDSRFMVYGQSAHAKSARAYLKDVINDSYEESLKDLLIIKLLATWSKTFPGDINDEWAQKYIYDHKIDFSKLDIKIPQKEGTMLAAAYSACDNKVRKYIMEYPNCTIINVGCGLENMFARLDNGRIQWYNVDSHNIISVRRGLYGQLDREKTIGRRITDLSWIDEIKCERNKGVLFVCKDCLNYMKFSQVQKLIDKIRINFPGAELVFEACTSGTNFYRNKQFKRKRNTMRERAIFSVDDVQDLFNSWRTDIRIKSEEPIMKFLDESKLSFKMTLSAKYNKISFNRKIICMKIGSEAYDINI